MPTIETTNFTKSSGKLGWSQVSEFKFPESIEMHLFTLAAVTKKKGIDNFGNTIDSVFLSKNILNSLKDKFLEKKLSKASPTLGTLKNTLLEIRNELSGFESMEFAAIFLDGETMYASSLGGAHIFIFRNDYLVPILSGAENEAKSASGVLKNGDIVILGTNSFLKESGKNLKSFLKNGGFEALSKKLTYELTTKEEDGIGFFAFKFLNQIENPNFVINGNTSEQPMSTSNGNDLSLNSLPKNKLTRFNIKNRLLPLFKKISEKRLYVKGEETPEAGKKRKVLASVGVLLIFALIGSILLGVSDKNKADLKDSYEKDLTLAKHSLSEAENLLQLNPERARELFIEGRSKVLGMSDQGIDDPELAELKNKIVESQGRILGEYKNPLELFLDLGLLSDGFVGSDVSVSGESLYVFDKNGERIAKTIISTKRSEIVAGPSIIDEVRGFSANDGRIYVLNSEGIFDVSREKKKLSDEVFTGEILVQGYGGNLYVLEKASSLIWRLTGNGEVFGDKKNWLKEDSALDLVNAGSWAVDGNIWIAEGSSVFKFAGGSKTNFRLSSETLNDFNVDYLYTSEESDFIYILDKKRGRILVFTKEGDYKAQYINEEINNVSDIAVFEEEKKIILLKENKLLSIEIKHL